MPITWRMSFWEDIEEGLSIQPKNVGGALVGTKAAVECWKQLARDPFFASIILEVHPARSGHRLIGFGASAIVSRRFVDAELAAPRPDINSRLLSNVCYGQPVLASRSEIARANAGEGVDILILYGSCWRDELLNAAERIEVQTIFASKFVEWHAGYKIGRVICETVDATARDHLDRSSSSRRIAEFPEDDRVLHMMSPESVEGLSAHLGNILFTYRNPVLRLRNSDQQLLLGAMVGATDLSLASELGVTLSAVKARWRSAFARIAATMPELIPDLDDHEGRGMQKRHRVLDYVRNHPEELRPYDWQHRDHVPYGVRARR